MNIQILKYVLFSILMVIGVNSASVLADPLSGVEKEGLLLELNTIQEVLDGNRVSLRTSAVATFQAAAANEKAVYEFFLQCHKQLKFDSRDASFSEFRKWRESNEKRMKSKTNLIAMRLQLQYLVLSLRAAEGVKPEVIMPELEIFVANIASHAKDLESGGMRTLQGSVKKTIFAEAYKLDKSLEMENWSYSPGDYGSVYEKAIFPYIRGAKPETLAATWDRRIGLEKRFLLATQENNPIALQKFDTERLPQLLWQKAVDVYKSFSEQQAAKSMLQMVKVNPDHPNIKKWVDEFRALLAGAKEQNTETNTENPVQPNRNNPLGFENP